MFKEGSQQKYSKRMFYLLTLGAVFSIAQLFLILGFQENFLMIHESRYTKQDDHGSRLQLSSFHGHELSFIFYYFLFLLKSRVTHNPLTTLLYTALLEILNRPTVTRLFKRNVTMAELLITFFKN